MRNTKLRSAIFEIEKTQRWLSRETGISEAIISMVINGRYNLDSAQKSRVAEALGKLEGNIF